MKTTEVVGIDVSKKTLDCHIHCSKVSEQFPNNPDAIADLICWAFEVTGLNNEEVLFVFEHTGLYSYHLLHLLSSENCIFKIVPGLEIKRSLGIARGKEDKVDAKRIALYGYRTREEMDFSQAPLPIIEELRRMMSMRKRLVAQRAGYKASLKEQRAILGTVSDPLLFTVQEKMIECLSIQISALEKKIDGMIVRDPDLNRMLKLLTSIKGIGKVTARFLIVTTYGFTAFETWRKYASYCGIAPFPNQSGTSVRGKTKVSNLANKDGKTLLTMCAMSAIQCDPEIRSYYNHRIESGKSKMSTINIIRNKLLSRAFAVIKRGSPYVDTMRYAA